MMAVERQTAGITAAFPAPPPFYRHFTEENLARFAELQGDAATTLSKTDGESQKLTSVLNLPPELRFLQPPSPPPNGRYRCFGEDHEISGPIPPLPAETPALYPCPPTPAHLIRLTRSLLLNFLEFVHILTTNPSITEYGPKWDDLRDLFRNVHQAVNEYRPHQAREALILLMESQVERGRKEKQDLEELKMQVDAVLAGLGERLDTGQGPVTLDEGREGFRHKETSHKMLESDKRVWAFLREETE